MLLWEIMNYCDPLSWVGFAVPSCRKSYKEKAVDCEPAQYGQYRGLMQEEAVLIWLPEKSSEVNVEGGSVSSEEAEHATYSQERWLPLGGKDGYLLWEYMYLLRGENRERREEIRCVWTFVQSQRELFYWAPPILPKLIAIVCVENSHATLFFFIYKGIVRSEILINIGNQRPSPVNLPSMHSAGLWPTLHPTSSSNAFACLVDSTASLTFASTYITALKGLYSLSTIFILIFCRLSDGKYPHFHLLNLYTSKVRTKRKYFHQLRIGYLFSQYRTSLMKFHYLHAWKVKPGDPGCFYFNGPQLHGGMAIGKLASTIFCNSLS